MKLPIVNIVTSPDDVSTSKVCAYLNTKKRSFLRYCNAELEPYLNVRIGQLGISARLSSFDYDFKSSFWYRRGDFDAKVFFSTLNSFADFSYYTKKESDVIKSYFHEIDKHISLGSLDKEINNNQLIDLTNAVSVGFYVPETVLTTHKKDVIIFSIEFKQVIIKALKVKPNFQIKDFSIGSNGSIAIQEKHINSLKDTFPPALFQEYIEKAYEIRVFYLKGKIYSMAIFSQLDEQTKTDYRNYNRAKPNRNVPYQLPLEIEEKIRLFMDKSGLDTGSLDIIRATDGRFVFLEVNPCGQFDWLSVNCNYYLEQKIANYLAYGTID